MEITNTLQTTVDKLKQFENNDHIQLQKDILNDLLNLKTILLKELADADTLPVNLEKKRKLDYQLMHLKKSYSELSHKYSSQKKQLEEENANLRKKVEEMSK